MFFSTKIHQKNDWFYLVKNENHIHIHYPLHWMAKNFKRFGQNASETRNGNSPRKPRHFSRILHYPLVMTFTVRHGIDGPNRNRWFTVLKNGWIFHGFSTFFPLKTSWNGRFCPHLLTTNRNTNPPSTQCDPEKPVRRKTGKYLST